MYSWLHLRTPEPALHTHTLTLPLSEHSLLVGISFSVIVWCKLFMINFLQILFLLCTFNVLNTKSTNLQTCTELCLKVEFSSVLQRVRQVHIKEKRWSRDEGVEFSWAVGQLSPLFGYELRTTDWDPIFIQACSIRVLFSVNWNLPSKC